MAAESRAELLDMGDDTQVVEVPTPEWKCGSVHVRSLTALERSVFEASFTLVKDGKVSRNLEAVKVGRGKLLALAICDAKGCRLLTDDDADAMARRNAAVVDRVCNKVLEISGMDDRSREGAEKNS